MKPAELPKAVEVAKAITIGWEPFGITVGTDRWVSNGHVALRVKTKARATRDEHASAVANMLKVAPRERPSVPGKAVRDGIDKVKRIGRWWVDARYVDLVEQFFPAGQWFCSVKKDDPLHVRVDGETVALVMSRRWGPGGEP